MSQDDAHEHVLADSAFHEFVRTHRRKYDVESPEFIMRQAIFKQRLAAVQSQNSRPDARWKAAVTRFSDFTEAERAVMRGYKGRGVASRQGASLLEEDTKEESTERRESIAETVDWRHLRVANHIIDQGGCGSCWAIATVSTLEAHYEIYTAKNGPTRTFSAQQTLECTPNPHECGGKGGCEGATVELGMAWIMEHGLATEDEVPYLATDGKCSRNNAEPSKAGNDFEVFGKNVDSPELHGAAAFGLVGWRTLPQNEDYSLAKAVATHGPVAVSAAASDWFEYSSGIFDGCKVDTIVDHAVTMYGYGKVGHIKYWLIRNSWGHDWGEQGFIRVLRHDEGVKHCGTDRDPSQGLGCKGGPKEVTVCGMCGVLFDSVVPHFVGSPSATNSSLLAKAPWKYARRENSASRTAKIAGDGAVRFGTSGAHPSLLRREIRRNNPPS
jgi:cathepsin L